MDRRLSGLFLILEFWLAINCLASVLKNNPDDSTNETTKETSLGCPHGWNAFGSKCYGFFGWNECKESWDHAWQKCLAQRSNLVSIHSKEEHDFLAQKVREKGNCNTWIGLREVLPETGGRQFRWSDESPLDLTQWYGGEPNNAYGFKEECVHLMFLDDYELTSVDYRGKWNDAKCGYRFCYICQTAKEILGVQDICKNDGTFTPDLISGGFRCVCRPGYKGMTCDEKIVRSEDICKNEGTLTADVLSGVFRCACKQGFKGQTCSERSVNEEYICKIEGMSEPSMTGG